MTADSGKPSTADLRAANLSISENARSELASIVTPQRRKRESSPSTVDAISEFLGSLDEHKTSGLAKLLEVPPTKEALSIAILRSSSGPLHYSFGSVPQSVLRSLTDDAVEPSFIGISAEMEKQLTKRGCAISNPPFKQTLGIIREHLLVGGEASGRMVIDQYLLAALDSAKHEIGTDKALSRDLVTRLQLQQRWSRNDRPHPVLSLESRVELVNVAKNITFSGYLDYLISFIPEYKLPDIRRGTTKNQAITSPSRVPLVVIEAKSLDDFSNAESQVMAQAIAMCNVANSSYFVSALTSGRDWRFYLAQKVGQGLNNAGTYQLFNTLVYSSEETPGLIVGLLVMAIVEDPATMLQMLQSGSTLTDNVKTS